MMGTIRMKSTGRDVNGAIIVRSVSLKKTFPKTYKYSSASAYRPRPGSVSTSAVHPSTGGTRNNSKPRWYRHSAAPSHAPARQGTAAGRGQRHDDPLARVALGWSAGATAA